MPDDPKRNILFNTEDDIPPQPPSQRLSREELLAMIAGARSTGAIGLNLGDKKIDEIPAEIGQLQKLKYLNVSGSELRDIPREIGNLTALRSLSLARNN